MILSVENVRYDKLKNVIPLEIIGPLGRGSVSVVFPSQWEILCDAESLVHYSHFEIILKKVLSTELLAEDVASGWMESIIIWMPFDNSLGRSEAVHRRFDV